MRPSPSKSSISTPAGASSAAARARAVLYDPALRLPESARIFTSRDLDRRDVGLETDLVREQEAAARKRCVPLEAEVGAVDRADELESDAVVAPRIGARADVLARQCEGLRDALHGQLAVDDEFAASGLDGDRLEPELRMALRVEELGRLHMPVARLVERGDRGSVGAARDRRRLSTLDGSG